MFVDIRVEAFVPSTGSTMPNPGEVFSLAGVFLKSCEIAESIVAAAAWSLALLATLRLVGMACWRATRPTAASPMATQTSIIEKPAIFVLVVDFMGVSC